MSTDRYYIRTTGQTGPGIAEHLADTTDAHDASAISVLDAAGNYTATDVEAVLAELPSRYAVYANLAANPDSIIVGTVTRDSNGAATSAPVVWPDGTTGVYTGTPSADFPGAVDSYSITYLGATTITYTQPTVTRNSVGAVTSRPAITVA